jgi:hypothetical protein
MVGGQAITGSTMRGLFSLRSACFTLQYSGESFLFNGDGIRARWGDESIRRQRHGKTGVGLPGDSWRIIIQVPYSARIDGYKMLALSNEFCYCYTVT